MDISKNFLSSILFRQFFSKGLLLYMFLLLIDMASPLPAINNGIHASLSVDKDNQFNGDGWSKTDPRPHGFILLTRNNSKEELKQAHITRVRRSSGCVDRHITQPCGKDLIATVECKKRSVSCINGAVAPRCIIIKTYFAACNRAFDTDCKCASS